MHQFSISKYIFCKQEAFLEIRNLRTVKTHRNDRIFPIIRTHLSLANICDTCQAQ